MRCFRGAVNHCPEQGRPQLIEFSPGSWELRLRILTYVEKLMAGQRVDELTFLDTREGVS